MTEDQAAALILDNKAYRDMVRNYEWTIVVADYGYGSNTRPADDAESAVLTRVAFTLGKISEPAQ